MRVIYLLQVFYGKFTDRFMQPVPTSMIVNGMTARDVVNIWVLSDTYLPNDIFIELLGLIQH